jgi:hypothetical protein
MPWDCDVTSVVDKCCQPQKYWIACRQRLLELRINTDELTMLSGVQLLIFAAVHAVWGPYVHSKPTMWSSGWKRRDFAGARNHCERIVENNVNHQISVGLFTSRKICEIKKLQKQNLIEITATHNFLLMLNCDLKLWFLKMQIEWAVNIWVVYHSIPGSPVGGPWKTLFGNVWKDNTVTQFWTLPCRVHNEMERMTPFWEHKHGTFLIRS